MLANRIVAGVIVFCLCIFGAWGASQIWENVEADEVDVIQAPFSGEIHVYTSPGTVLQNFGSVTTYKRRAAYEFECTETKVQRTRMTKVDGKDVPVNYMASVWTGGNDIRFNDGGHGTICGSLQFEVPSDPNQVKDLYQRFKGQDALKSLLKKQTDSAIYLAGQLMSSKESYNESRNDLIHYISDQIQNGVYRTKTESTSAVDPITQQPKLVSVAKIITDPSGAPQRQEPSALHQFGVKIFNFTISRLPYDEQVEDQIQQQQRLTMDVQTSVAELKKAEQRNATVEQQGRANATEEKWKQEAIKAQKVTEAEQNKSVAETEANQRLNVARLDRQAAEETKQKEILLGEGESTRRQLVMNADGALAVKVDAYKYAVDKFSDAMARYQGNWVPQIEMGAHPENGAGSGALALMDVLNAQALKSLGLDIGIKTGPVAQPTPARAAVNK